MLVVGIPVGVALVGLPLVGFTELMGVPVGLTLVGTVVGLTLAVGEKVLPY